MELLPKEVLDRLPPLGSSESLGYDAIVQVKYFTPDGNWTWWVLEYDPAPAQQLFFGLVKGFEEEFGYFSYDELKDIRGALNLPVERDLYFKPIPLGELLKELGKGK